MSGKKKPVESGFTLNLNIGPVFDPNNCKRKVVYNTKEKLFWRKGTKIVFNHRWYFRLVPGFDRLDQKTNKIIYKDTPCLYNEHPKDTLCGKFVVCMNIMEELKGESISMRLFSFFDSFNDF